MVKLFVEGGGDHRSILRSKCREGFRRFLERAGLSGKMPRDVACGGRRQAYDDFCTAMRIGETALLLVDSEAPISEIGNGLEPNEFRPWIHLANRVGDQWPKPANAEDEHCHLMVECMENWFLADRHALLVFFGQYFSSTLLPAESRAVETVSKNAVASSLLNATRHCDTKGQYHKGRHSFEILGQIDPFRVAAASPWAARFIAATKRQMDC